MWRIFIFCFALLLCLSQPIIAQSSNTIQGIVQDDYNDPIAGASITITDAEGNILAYDISKQNGEYAIVLPDVLTPIQINVSALGFQAQNQVIEKQSQNLDFNLTEDAVQLEEMLVKSPPITQRGDTVNYNVDSFAKTQDRTIADIIKRLPGFEVESNGRILYQGKAINKYYIEGLDLLGGRYNLANENLPYQEVEKVQVLENHQPIRVLDSLESSNQAAINIKLKNQYTTTGQAEVGVGLSPMLWDANVTPMIFSKNQQMLLSYQSNNIGDDVSKQLNILTVDEFISQLKGGGARKEDWLSIQQLQLPPFSSQRFLDNNIHLLTANFLQKITNDYELKINASYLNDYQQQFGTTNSLFFTNTDTIALEENQYNQFYSNSLQADLILTKNIASSFVENKLRFKGFWDGARGTISNTQNTTQNLSNRYFALSNQLKTIFKVGSQLLRANSTLNISKTPQRLSLGFSDSILFLDENTTSLQQRIDLNQFATNNSVGFTKSYGNFTFTPKLGFRLLKQNLESNLKTAMNSNLNQTFTNDLVWLETELYGQLNSLYKKDKLSLQLQLPISYVVFDLEDEFFARAENENRWIFQPRFSVAYQFNAKWRFNTSLGRSNQLGNINQWFFGSVLRNYRQIEQNNTILPETWRLNYRARIKYKNTRKSWFANVAYQYEEVDNNILIAREVLSNGTNVLSTLAQDNKEFTQQLSGEVSKYFVNLAASLSLGSSVYRNQSVQIINDIQSNVQLQRLGLNLKIDKDINDWLGFAYKTNWSFLRSEINAQSNPSVLQHNHTLDLNVFPAENHYLEVSLEYFYNDLLEQSASNYFANLVYRYTLPKKKIDLEVQFTNIFNVKSFSRVIVNPTIYTENNFLLRPRQLLCKLRFSF